MQKRNFTLAFQAAESVGIKSTLVSPHPRESLIELLVRRNVVTGWGGHQIVRVLCGLGWVSVPSGSWLLMGISGVAQDAFCLGTCPKAPSGWVAPDPRPWQASRGTVPYVCLFLNRIFGFRKKVTHL